MHANFGFIAFVVLQPGQGMDERFEVRRQVAGQFLGAQERHFCPVVLRDRGVPLAIRADDAA